MLAFDCIPYYDYGKIMHCLLEAHIGGEHINDNKEYMELMDKYFKTPNGSDKINELKALTKLEDMLQSYKEDEEVYSDPTVELKFKKGLIVNSPKRLPCGACTTVSIPLLGFIDVYVEKYENDKCLIVDHKLKKKTWFKLSNIETDVQFLTYHWAMGEGYTQVNELLPNNKKKLFKPMRVEVTQEMIDKHVNGWLIPSVEAVLKTILAYEQGGMEAIYENKNNCGKCCMAYGTMCEYSQRCYGLNKEIDWL